MPCGTEGWWHRTTDLFDSALFPWQGAVWAHLVDYHQSGRLPHALLFAGPHGTGKTHLARCFAQRLLCERPINTGLACGTCTACRRFVAGSHPDFLWVRSDASQDATEAVGEDGLSTEAEKSEEKTKGSRYIRIDQIRALSKWLELTSHCGGPQVALLTSAEQMNANAANSLLKTLEDPPGGVLLMLATAHPARLPATLRSRCQTVVFPMIAAEAASAWLITQGITDRATALSLLSLAGGGPLAALALGQSGLLALRMTVFAELEGIVMGRLSPIAVAQAWLTQELESILALQWGLLAEMIRITLMFGPVPADPEGAERLRRMAEHLGIRRLYARLDHLHEALRLARSTTQANKQLLLEDLLIPWRVS